MIVVRYGIIAAAVFVLSVLVGALSGVRAGIFLIRALVWAAVFTGLSFGIAELARKFLPGLFDEDAAGVRDESEEPETGESGNQVDIVVDEEIVENQFARLAGGPGLDEDEDRAPSIIPSIVEEVEESTAELGDDAFHTDDEPAEESGDRIDELPDIGGFAGSFVNSAQNGDAGDSEDYDDYGSAPKSSKNAGNDPAAIAKALQTMLKKD